MVAGDVASALRVDGDALVIDRESLRARLRLPRLAVLLCSFSETCSLGAECQPLLEIRGELTPLTFVASHSCNRRQAAAHAPE